MMKKITRILSSLLLIYAAESICAEKKEQLELVLLNNTHHSVYFKCGNASYPGSWSGPKTIRVNTDENPRRLQYRCSIALPNRGEKEIVAFGPADFVRSEKASRVILIIEGIDTKTKCAPNSHAYHAALVTFTFIVDGNFIKRYESVCFQHI